MSKARFQAYVDQVEAHLAQTLPSEEKGFYETILAAMNYSLHAGGKRLRSVLILATAEALGTAPNEELLEASAAIECIHTYSLIHDDLPGMDNDDLRRGKPTNHKVFGEAMAILAGDGLLTEAFVKLSTAVKDSHLATALVRELAQGAGYRGMVGGQAQDILSEHQVITGEHMKAIHAAKTGALITCACRMGALLGGADEKTLQALTEYGQAIGLAFQIIDDILDVVGDEATLGKPVGSDISAEKSTYPALYGLEASRHMAAEARDRAKAALAKVDGDTSVLTWLADYIVERDK